jgi:hypothetical protein
VIVVFDVPPNEQSIQELCSYLVARKDGQDILGLESIGILQTSSKLLGLNLKLAECDGPVVNGVDEESLATLNVAWVGIEVVVDVDLGVNGIGVRGVEDHVEVLG